MTILANFVMFGNVVTLPKLRFNDVNYNEVTKMRKMKLCTPYEGMFN